MIVPLSFITHTCSKLNMKYAMCNRWCHTQYTICVWFVFALDNIQKSVFFHIKIIWYPKTKDYI